MFSFTKEKGGNINEAITCLYRAASLCFSGIWYKNALNFDSWWEKFHLSGAQFQTEYTAMPGNG
jgi:hypothetical protein